MKQRLLFIFNLRSGKGKIKENLAEIVDIMVKAGWEVTVYTTQCQGDAVEKARLEAGEYDRIVCSGGDGTLDEVVTGMMKAKSRVPIGYIPAGSTNDFGNSLGIDKDMRKAAQIAASGRMFPCDIGRFNDDFFVYVAAFGLFTDVSYQTSQDMKNVLGHAAYILEGAKQLWDIPSVRMQVEYDGNVLYDEFIYGMITNSNSVGGFDGLISGDVILNDGVFEVTLIKTPKNPLELNDLLGAIMLRQINPERMYSFKSGCVQFESMEAIPWTLDGEYGGTHEEVVVRNKRQALQIMVRQEVAAGLSAEKMAEEMGEIEDIEEA